MFVSEKIPNISQQTQKETTLTDNSTVSSKSKPVGITETTSQTNTEKSQTIGDYTEKIISPSDYSIIQRQESTQFWVGSGYATAPNLAWSNDYKITQIKTQTYSHYTYNATDNIYWLTYDGNVDTILYSTQDGQNRKLVINEPVTFDNTQWANNYVIGNLPAGAQVEFKVPPLMKQTPPIRFIINTTNIQTQKQETLQPSTSSISSNNASTNTGIAQSQPASPSITLAGLKNYALQLINNDRASNGLPSVTLSDNQAAQIQANDMLHMQKLSHYMSDGEKPYMSYTKYGGLGNVAQNAAGGVLYSDVQGCINGIYICDPIDPMEQIKTSENEMMYNDLACCNNGHHDNILNKYHTDVSIGIAYDKYSFFMTQNFEDNYMSFTTPPSENNGIVTFAGNLKSGSLMNIGIYYDPLPTKDIYEQHKNDGFYKLGDEVVTVEAPPQTGSYYPPDTQTFEVADKLIQAGNYLDTSFDLSPFVTKAGVYTVVVFLQNGAEQFPITSYSITKPSPMVPDGFKSPKVNYACTQNQLDQYNQLQQQYDTLKKQYDSTPKTATSNQEYQQDMQMYNQLNSLQNQMENFRC